MKMAVEAARFFLHCCPEAFFKFHFLLISPQNQTKHHYNHLKVTLTPREHLEIEGEEKRKTYLQCQVQSQYECKNFALALHIYFDKLRLLGLQGIYMYLFILKM